jgi:hypothetical protein
MIEKSRARTLSESLSEKFSEKTAKPTKLSKKLADLREELNWFYSRLNRAGEGEFENLQKETKRREKQIADVLRQIESTRGAQESARGFLNSSNSTTRFAPLP